MNQILITNTKISRTKLKELCELWFEDMIKIVVDVRMEWIGMGGELHADAEEKLLNHGSKQEDIWGVNFYPWHDPNERIEYTAMINIRPNQDNTSMEIQEVNIRNKIKDIIETLVLSPDEKMV